MDYTLNTDQQLPQMLQTIGVGSFEQLLGSIPAEVRCKTFDVPPGLSESEVLELCGGLAAQNRPLTQVASFLGAGAYQHSIPTVVDAISTRGEWLTPYTPYQAEASQGTLQMIYEFQPLICELMQMEVANASLYDGASSLAEAALVALRATGRPRLLVSEAIHPHARQVLSTYLSGFPCQIQEIPFVNGVTDLEALAAALKDDVAGVLLQHPNVFGCLEPVEQASDLTPRTGSLFVTSVYPISLGVLKPPGSYRADVAVAEGRCLGSPIAYGGPGLGLFTSTESLVRRLPGRLAGCSVDHHGRRAFTLTLQTREQHIRRERATSNVCTNAGWLCLRATIFLSLLGPQGLKDLANLNLQKAHDAFSRLCGTGAFTPAFEQPFFNECTLRLTDPALKERLSKPLLKAGIVGGWSLQDWYPALSDASVWCVTELLSRAQVDRLIDLVKQVAG